MARDFYIGDAVMVNCDRTLRYVIDFDFHEHQDQASFYQVDISQGKNVIWESEPIGNNGTYQGFFIHHIRRNGDESITWRSKPSDFTFQDPEEVGQCRIIFDTDNQDVTLRITAGGIYSRVDFRTWCKRTNFVVRIDTLDICYKPLQERQAVLTANCDTIYKDSVDRSLEGILEADTVQAYDNNVEPGYYTTDWRVNEYGCPVPWKVLEVIDPIEEIYIPNAVGRENPIWRPSKLCDEVKVYNRSGSLVYQYPGDPWGWVTRYPGVYTYFLRRGELVITGDITVIR